MPVLNRVDFGLMLVNKLATDVPEGFIGPVILDEFEPVTMSPMFESLRDGLLGSTAQSRAYHVSQLYQLARSSELREILKKVVWFERYWYRDILYKQYAMLSPTVVGAEDWRVSKLIWSAAEMSSERLRFKPNGSGGLLWLASDGTVRGSAEPDDAGYCHFTLSQDQELTFSVKPDPTSHISLVWGTTPQLTLSERMLGLRPQLLAVMPSLMAQSKHWLGDLDRRVLYTVSLSQAAGALSAVALSLLLVSHAAGLIFKKEA